MEIDLQENPWLTWLSLAVITALALVGLAFIGRSATPRDAVTGEPRVMQWSDWQALQLRRARAGELSVLRGDLNAIALQFQFPPDPVAAQLLQSRVSQHTGSGQPTLQMARAAVQNAADGLSAWAGGQIEREEMIALLAQAEAALK